jgi:hypothetical protein
MLLLLYPEPKVYRENVCELQDYLLLFGKMSAERLAYPQARMPVHYQVWRTRCIDDEALGEVLSEGQAGAPIYGVPERACIE